MSIAKKLRAVVLLAAAIALPSACSKSKAQTAEERERALRKTIIGSESGRPIMGQFVLKKADAARVNAAFKESSRAAFELASKLAAEKWVYEDRWCDDAVRQIVFLQRSEQDALATTADALWSKLRSEILDRHHLMYKERTPEACERSLRRMHEAKLAARKGGMAHMHFGY